MNIEPVRKSDAHHADHETNPPPFQQDLKRVSGIEPADQGGDDQERENLQNPGDLLGKGKDGSSEDRECGGVEETVVGIIPRET